MYLELVVGPRQEGDEDCREVGAGLVSPEVRNRDFRCLTPNRGQNLSG